MGFGFRSFQRLSNFVQSEFWRLRPIALEEPSEKVGPVKDPKIPQRKVLQPETLVKVKKKLPLNPSAHRHTFTTRLRANL